MGRRGPAKKMIQRLDQTNEYDREPISGKNLHGGRYFAGLFAGEHVAATEFVIGALFVSWGAGIADIIFGLLLGNLFAVLSWAGITAPIAVQVRLTLYWYLRRIVGPVVTIIYNVLNAVLYCVLAGAMITVAASAVRIPFHIPAQTSWFPEDIRFVLVVLVVGAVVVTFAILGFKRVAQFSTLSAPWMIIMFVAGALVSLPLLAASVPEIGQIRSFADFWNLADQTIWTGKAAGQMTPLGFWHVAAFAWIANLAMHVGLSDMAILRYARRAAYGFYSAFGMYLGHYLAWIAAGIMGAAAAAAMQRPLIELDAGGVAFYALGVSGAVAVVIAGLTTSNPTLYRAGLALQAVTPNWPRWQVTLIAGLITTLVACSPFVFTKLLDFVGLYGLLLMPIGAVVVVEHWIFPRIGFTRYWVTGQGRLLNWPALAAWVLAILIAMVLWQTGVLHLFFLFIPVWFITSILYIAFAAMAGATKPLSAEDEEPVEDISRENDDTGAAEGPAGKAPVGGSNSQYPLLAKLAGIVALVALLISVALPLQVLLMGADGLMDRVEWIKDMLLWLTLIYFISGTVWVYSRERGK